jgi:hypothetical protein
MFISLSHVSLSRVLATSDSACQPLIHPRPVPAMLAREDVMDRRGRVEECVGLLCDGDLFNDVHDATGAI